MKLLISTSAKRKRKPTDDSYTYTGSAKSVARKTAAYIKESRASILPALDIDNLKWILKDLDKAASTGDDFYLDQALSEFESNFKVDSDRTYVLDQDGKGGAFVIRVQARG